MFIHLHVRGTEGPKKEQSLQILDSGSNEIVYILLNYEQVKHLEAGGYYGFSRTVGCYNSHTGQSR